MAKYGSDKVAFLLVDGYSILGVTTVIRDDKEALLERTDSLGDSWEEFTYVGLKRASFEQEGFYDDASGSVNAALVSQEGVSRVLCYGVEGDTIGQQFVGFQGAMQADYRRGPARGELHKATARYEGNGQVDDGKILHTHTAETGSSGDTESSSVDNSASSASGGAGYLQVSALTLGGYTDVTIKVRHSADDITYADLITFTAVTSAPTAERKTVSGTVNRYLASSYAFGGSGSGQSVTFMVGFSRG